MSTCLYIELTSTSGSIQLPTEIVPQELNLMQIRVEFDTAANALAAQVIYLNFPWLSNIQTMNSTTYNGLPILLDNAIVTLRDTNIDFKLQRHISEGFTYSINGASLTGLSKVSLLFNHSVGTLV